MLAACAGSANAINRRQLNLLIFRKDRRPLVAGRAATAAFWIVAAPSDATTLHRADIEASLRRLVPIGPTLQVMPEPAFSRHCSKTTAAARCSGEFAEVAAEFRPALKFRA
jgi:hypothetical protein